MAIRKLERDEWAPFFDTFSKNSARENRVDYAEIRVVSSEDGVQPETSWVPLEGIVYDRKGDLLEVRVKNLDHLAYHPEEIYVDEEGDVLLSLQVVRQDGTTDIVELR